MAGMFFVLDLQQGKLRCHEEDRSFGRANDRFTPWNKQQIIINTQIPKSQADTDRVPVELLKSDMEVGDIPHNHTLIYCVPFTSSDTHAGRVELRSI